MAADIKADVFVDARPEEVFEHFTRPELLQSWMGERAALDPTVGGCFSVDVGGTAVRGRFLEVDPPSRLVISWGFEGSAELPPEASTLEVHLVPDGQGTRVSVVHRLLPPRQQGPHGSGWPRYLDQLARVARVGRAAHSP